MGYNFKNYKLYNLKKLYAIYSCLVLILKATLTFSNSLLVTKTAYIVKQMVCHK